MHGCIIPLKIKIFEQLFIELFYISSLLFVKRDFKGDKNINSELILRYIAVIINWWNVLHSFRNTREEAITSIHFTNVSIFIVRLDFCN